MAAEELDRLGMFRELRGAVARAGSQAAFAAKIGISATYLSDVLNARRDPGETILAALGLARVTRYRRIKKGRGS